MAGPARRLPVRALIPTSRDRSAKRARRRIPVPCTRRAAKPDIFIGGGPRWTRTTYLRVRSDLSAVLSRVGGRAEAIELWSAEQSGGGEWTWLPSASDRRARDFRRGRSAGNSRLPDLRSGHKDRHSTRRSEAIRLTASSGTDLHRQAVGFRTDRH